MQFKQPFQYNDDAKIQPPLAPECESELSAGGAMCFFQGTARNQPDACFFEDFLLILDRRFHYKSKEKSMKRTKKALTTWGKWLYSSSVSLNLG